MTWIVLPPPLGAGAESEELSQEDREGGSVLRASAPQDSRPGTWVAQQILKGPRGRVLLGVHLKTVLIIGVKLHKLYNYLTTVLYSIILLINCN